MVTHRLSGMRRRRRAGCALLRGLRREARGPELDAARDPQGRHGAVRRRDRQSTALGEQLDPEALRALMNRYFARMRVVIEAPRRDGREVHRRRGDGGVRDPPGPRGRRPARGPGRGRDPGRPRGDERGARGGARDRDPLPDRGQHGRGGGGRPGQRAPPSSPATPSTPRRGWSRRRRRARSCWAGSRTRWCGTPSTRSPSSRSRPRARPSPWRRTAWSRSGPAPRAARATSTRRWSAASGSSERLTRRLAVARSRTARAPVHAARLGRGRQEPPRPQSSSASVAGEATVLARPMPQLRRGHHLLADRRDRPRRRRASPRRTTPRRPGEGAGTPRRRARGGRPRRPDLAPRSACRSTPAPQEEVVWAVRRLLEHLAGEPAAARRHRGHPLGRAHPARPRRARRRLGAGRADPASSARRAPSCSTSSPGWGGGKLNATTILPRAPRRRRRRRA